MQFSFRNDVSVHASVALLVLSITLSIHTIFLNSITSALLLASSVVFALFSIFIVGSFLSLSVCTSRLGSFLLTVFFIIGQLRVSGLFLSRSIHGRPGLIWNPDWAFSLGHAFNIADSGSLVDSISYAGGAEVYHAGPAYIAGLIASTTPLSVETISLVIIPALLYAFFIYVLFYLFRAFLISDRRSAMATCFFSILPGATAQGYTFLSLDVLRFTSFADYLSSTFHAYLSGKPFFLLMHNSQLGICVALAVFLLLLVKPNDYRYLAIAAIATVSLYYVKPHYFVGVFLLVATYSFFSIFLPLNIFRLHPRKRAVLSSDPRYIVSLVCQASGSGIAYILLTLLFFLLSRCFPVPAFYESRIYFGYLSGVVSAIRDLDLQQAFDATGQALAHSYRYIFSARSTYLFVVLVLASPWTYSHLRVRFARASIVLYLAGLCIVFLSVFFPISYSVALPNPISLSLIPPTDDSWPLGGSLYQVTETQAEILFSSCLCFILCASVFSCSRNLPLLTLSPTLVRKSGKSAVLAIVSLAVAEIVSAVLLVVNPEYAQYLLRSGVDDFTPYVRALASVDKDSSIVLTNDVRQGFKGRNFRSTHLTAFSPHKHYLSNVADFHWRSQADVVSRLRLYREIFESPGYTYCPKLTSSIVSQGITHLIVFGSLDGIPVLQCPALREIYGADGVSVFGVDRSI